jgi:hypothetical protein
MYASLLAPKVNRLISGGVGPHNGALGFFGFVSHLFLYSKVTLQTRSIGSKELVRHCSFIPTRQNPKLRRKRKDFSRDRVRSQQSKKVAQ